AAAPMLHPVERSIRCSQKLFRCVTVFRKRGDSGTGRERRAFRLGGHAFTNTRNDARSNVTACFREDYGELIAPVTCSRINCAAMATKNLAEADDCAAAGKVAILIVDGFEAIHVKKGDTKRALRPARTIKFSFHHADQAAIVGKSRE